MGLVAAHLPDDVPTASRPADKANLNLVHQYAAHYHQTRSGTTVNRQRRSFPWECKCISAGTASGKRRAGINLGRKNRIHPTPPEPPSGMLREQATTQHNRRHPTAVQMARNAPDGTPVLQMACCYRWHTAPVAQSFCTVPSADMCSMHGSVWSQLQRSTVR
jgi:hypothetical protein